MSPLNPLDDNGSGWRVARWIKAWNWFWFRPGDPTTLGLIRICCGLITLYLHFAYTGDLQEFFGKDAWFNLRLADQFRHEAPWVAPPVNWSSPAYNITASSNLEDRENTLRYVQRWGVDPHVTLSQGNYAWSVWFHVTDPNWMKVVHGVILAVIFLFAVGFCTRITSVLTWLAAVSYIQRSPTTLFGMDTMMNVSLLYLMIGPSGAALSVDRLIAKFRAARRGEAFTPVPAPQVSANFVLRLFQVHFCIIYMAAGLSKLLGGAWWNGTALWGTLANYEFTPLRLQFYAEVLRWLCQHRLLWEIVMTGGVVYTLAMEIGFPFLVWNPRFRGTMVAGAVLLHTGIAFSMGLIGFGLFMLAMVVSFLPGSEVRRRVRELADRAPGFSGRFQTSNEDQAVRAA